MDLCFQPLKNETSSFKGFQINTVQQIKIGQTQQSVEEAYCLSKRIIQIQAAWRHSAAVWLKYMTATEWISLFSLFIVIKTENEGWMPHKWSLIFILLSDAIWKLFLKAVSSLWDQEGNCEVRLVLKMWSEVFSLQTGWDRMLTRSWRYNSSLDEPASRSSNDLFFFSLLFCSPASLYTFPIWSGFWC